MVEIVGCSTAHPAKARPMPDRQCQEVGCPYPVHARGRCSKHYLQWWKYDEFVPAPPPAPRVEPVGMCPMCGPWERVQGHTLNICPTCDMTPGEHAYRLRIMADSAAVYAQEVREFNARRRDGKA